MKLNGTIPDSPLELVENPDVRKVLGTAMIAAFAVAASAAETAASATKTLTLPGGVTMELIYVAPGTFTMGSPSSEAGRFDDETQHQVTLTKGFWFGKYEVTQRQWRSVMGNNPSRFKGDDRPVETVSWDDCRSSSERSTHGSHAARGFRRRRNGNMPAVPARRRRTAGEMP